MERYATDIGHVMARRSDVRLTVYARSFGPADSGPDRSGGSVDRQNGAGEGIERRQINTSWLPGKLRGAWFSRALARVPCDWDALISCTRVRNADIAICGGTHRGYLAASGKAVSLWDRREISLESAMYARARFLVAHSALMARELQELYGLDDAKIHLIHPPVDAKRFRPVADEERAALRHEFGFRADEVVLLFPSTGHKRKGFDQLVAAAQRAGGAVTLAVAGRGVGGSFAHVRELGYVSNIERLYPAADFTALASDYEPFGLVGVESVLCGTPLLFAGNIACLEVLDGFASERFRRGDAADLDAALARAVARVRGGAARLGHPMELLRYDPGVDRHVDALLGLCQKVAEDRHRKCD